jgi:hypothetical protein
VGGRILVSGYSGRPFGPLKWQEEIAKRLGLESAYRPTGRPRKIGLNQDAAPAPEQDRLGKTAFPYCQYRTCPAFHQPVPLFINLARE